MYKRAIIYLFIINLNFFFQMEIDEKNIKGEGFKPYYITKIEELQLIVTEKSQNLRRLQAQRNELNAKGTYLDDGNIIVIFRKV